MSKQSFVYHFEISQANADLLDQPGLVKDSISQLVELSGFTILETIDHVFKPQGISVVALLAESHIAIHTWPESGTAYVTLATCKQPSESFISDAKQILTRLFDCGAVVHKEIS